MTKKKQIVLFIFFIAIHFFTSSVIFAAEEKGFHKKIDKLILAKKLDEAEKLAKEAYKKNPDDPEVICALACVYRNKALKSAINVNTSAMGIKDGERIADVGDLLFTSTAPEFDSAELLDIHTRSKTFSVYYPKTRPG
ncbi:MAG: tetratricopeptide repeat protein, partial [bacterium]